MRIYCLSEAVSVWYMPCLQINITFASKNACLHIHFYNFVFLLFSVSFFCLFKDKKQKLRTNNKKMANTDNKSDSSDMRATADDLGVHFALENKLGKLVHLPCGVICLVH